MALYKAKAAGKNAVYVANFNDISHEGDAKAVAIAVEEDQTKLA